MICFFIGLVTGAFAVAVCWWASNLMDRVIFTDTKFGELND